MDIFISACDFSKSMMNEACLPNASGGYQNDVALIVQGAKQRLGLLFAIAEIFPPFIAIDDERIIQLFHISRFMFYEMSVAKIDN